MLVVALTGGIGSGKSLVLNLFEQAGCHVISMDAVSKLLSEPGHAAFEPIIETFGDQILTPDKHINRKVLAQQVFSDSHKKQQLEAILHPLITQEVRRQLRQISQKADKNVIVIIEIPLLTERNQFDFIDRVLVVESDPSLQLARVITRDKDRTKKDIQQIIDSQINDQQRRKLADDILYNKQDVAQLTKKVKSLYKQYCSLS